jgi:hypothetical protein
VEVTLVVEEVDEEVPLLPWTLLQFKQVVRVPWPLVLPVQSLEHRL